MWFYDDKTFCPNNKCRRTRCSINPKNIREKDAPHSYYVEIPERCPYKKRKEKKE